MDAFLKTKQQVLDELGVLENKGLSEEEAVDNAVRFGTNSLSRPPQESLLKKIWLSLTEPMILLLVIAALIALGVNYLRGLSGGETEYIECVGIGVAIFLSVAISLVMEGKSAKAFEALNKIKEGAPAKVFRNGKVRLVSQKDIVVGDIICLDTGAKIPADGRLLESIDLQVEEASLTGESEPVKKRAEAVFTDEELPLAERTNMLYAGTFITGGSGKMIITAVGDSTEFGLIARELTFSEKSMTPLQEKLTQLGNTIAVWGISMAGLAFAIQLCIFLINGTATLDNISSAFITSIVLIVAAVPEGLPTTVAICLAINIIKMSKENALVKKMIACETIGCINVICSDKTGTLTENRMTVVNVFEPNGLKNPENVQDKYLLTNFCVNSTADIGFEDNHYTFIGNPTECALLVTADKSGNDYHKIRRSTGVVHTYPFSSETKNMTTVVRSENGYTAYTKGSPEKVLSMSNLSPEKREEIESEIRKFQEKACRVIAFAHKDASSLPSFEKERTTIESDMVFDGFTAIADPLRKDVYSSVRSCRDAGIDIKMLTGDNIITAKAIADDLHLLDNDHIAIEAKEIDSLDDKELFALLPKIRVIARSTPLIKMRIVKALKTMGGVVAVTGDGINDAPAIKNADIGLAMGISGTEVSKEASDVVLLDDSFSTIVKAVQWGRGIYENFQRFIMFQLTVNLSSVVVVLLSILAGFPTPFTALQLLWVNLIMDGPPALTLSLEPVRNSLMKNDPTPRNSNIVTKDMLIRIIFGGVFITVIFMLQTIFNFLGAQSPEEERTVLFTLFVLFQLVNAFNCRELTYESVFKHFFENKMMIIAFTATFLLQVFITQYGQRIFGTVPLSMGMWIKVFALSFSIIIASEAFKLTQLIRYKRKRV